MQFNATFWSSAGTIITAIATILLAVVTYRLFVATQRLAEVSREMNILASSNARSQTDAMLIAALNEQNAIVLGDERNLRAADKLIAHRASTIQTSRRVNDGSHSFC
jgi:hypothetical protein